MDDGFSVDLGQDSLGYILPPLPPVRPPIEPLKPAHRSPIGWRRGTHYKPEFVSPLAARFAPRSVKPDFISPLSTRGPRRYQNQTAAHLAGCQTCNGLGQQVPRRLAYKMSSTSPLYARHAPHSSKPDFVSALDTGGKRSTRFMQTRAAASLAGLFNQFDPNVPVTTDAGSRAIDVARKQIGLDPRLQKSAAPSDDSAMIIDDGSGDEEIILTDDTEICTETMFKNEDCSMKAAPIIGGLVVAAVALAVLTRG